jgi:hypothetical protein
MWRKIARRKCKKDRFIAGNRTLIGAVLFAVVTRPYLTHLLSQIKFGIENGFEMFYDIDIVTRKKGANSMW